MKVINVIYIRRGEDDGVIKEFLIFIFLIVRVCLRVYSVITTNLTRLGHRVPPYIHSLYIAEWEVNDGVDLDLSDSYNHPRKT
jgi:hypothetical protein